eukprot:12245277-Heterocapsa_arctica.AAC.1
MSVLQSVRHDSSAQASEPTHPLFEEIPTLRSQIVRRRLLEMWIPAQRGRLVYYWQRQRPVCSAPAVSQFD